MPHVQCPSCGLRMSAAPAPHSCPRCLVRRRGRFELVPVGAPRPSRDRQPAVAGKGGAGAGAGV